MMPSLARMFGTSQNLLLLRASSTRLPQAVLCADVQTRKRSSEYYDPCQEFANKSIRCMHRNAGDKDMCQDYFQAYRDCKKEWTTRRRFGRGSESWQTENKAGPST